MSWWKRLIRAFAPVVIQRFLAPAEVEVKAKKESTKE